MTTLVDPYLSRLENHWETRDRIDPVVYGEHPGPLQPSQLEQYEQQGFIQLTGLLDPTTLSDLVHNSQIIKSQVEPQDPRIIHEPGSGGIRSIFEIHEINSVFKAITQHPVLAGIARQILGSQVYIHQSRVNYKPGFEGKEFYWHSDFETWHMEDGMARMRALSCVISLNENHSVNGPLMLIPGSHKRYISCAGKTPENHYQQSLKKQEYGVPPREALDQLVAQQTIEAITGPAGTVVFFDCNTMHGSAGNITPYPRNNLFFVFNSVENRLEAPFCGLKPRPQYIANRNA